MTKLSLSVSACVVIFTAACSSGCGPKTIEPLVTVEKSVRTTVVGASTIVEPMVCNPDARKMLSNKPCLALLDVLEPTVDAVIEYNLALQSGGKPNIARTFEAITKLIAAIKAIVPDSPDRARAIGDLTAAGAQVQGGR